MNPTMITILIGVAAGLAAAMLSVGSVVQNALSFILFALSPLPILLAGLGWGPVAGVLSALVCGLSIYGFAAEVPAIVLTLTTAIPAALTAYYGGMARTNAEGKQEWFPLGDILFRLALIVATGFVISGYIIGYNGEFAEKLSVELVKQLAGASADFAADPVATIALANFVVQAIPVIQPASWLLVLTANLWLALLIARRSGLFRRVKDDWPTALRLPSITLPLFAFVMAGTFLTGGLGMVIWVFAGALGMAFVMTGFSYVHAITRGKPWRPAALWLSYFSILTVGLTVVLFLFAGLYSAAKNSASRGNIN